MITKLEGKKVVGIKETIKMIKNNQCEKVLIAKNAETKIIKPLVDLAENKSLNIEYIDTMKDLGKLCGIDVGAAAAAVLK